MANLASCDLPVDENGGDRPNAGQQSCGVTRAVCVIAGRAGGRPEGSAVASAGERDECEGTIKAELPASHLLRRAEQLAGVVGCLRQRAGAADAGALERAGVLRALADFESELGEVRDRLDRSARPGSAVTAC